MKQRREQDAFKLALRNAYSMWNTGGVSINQAIKLTAKQCKVNAEDLAGEMLKYVKHKLKED